MTFEIIENMLIANLKKFEKVLDDVKKDHPENYEEFESRLKTQILIEMIDKNADIKELLQKKLCNRMFIELTK